MIYLLALWPISGWFFAWLGVWDIERRLNKEFPMLPPTGVKDCIGTLIGFCILGTVAGPLMGVGYGISLLNYSE